MFKLQDVYYLENVMSPITLGTKCSQFIFRLQYTDYNNYCKRNFEKYLCAEDNYYSESGAFRVIFAFFKNYLLRLIPEKPPFKMIKCFIDSFFFLLLNGKS